MPTSLTTPSFAKLNLALAVSKPEPAQLPDASPNPRAGWHRICSLFSCIDLADELTLTPSTGSSNFIVRWADDAPVRSPIDWPIEKDLAVRAHAMAEGLAGRSLPVEAVLTKRIPVGGGMGGGSSNAAAMLRGLGTLFGLDPSSLLQIGAKLGSDVSFFLDAQRSPGEPARPALVEGFGEQLCRRDPIASEVVLICPPISCPTPAVYRAFDRKLSETPSFRFREREVRALFESRSSLRSASLFNDLAEPAFDVAPTLREIRELASQALPADSPVHVTGSGSTLFVVTSALEATHVADALDRALGSRAVMVRASLS